MSKLRSIFIFAAVSMLAVAGNGLAQGKFDAGVGSLYGTAVTTSQTAVFAAFLADSPAIPGAPAGLQASMSVSNVLATPDGFLSDFIDLGGGDRQGTVEIFLWNEDGSMYTVASPFDLLPGQTITVQVRDILELAGFPEDQIFLGYAWVVANFDGVAGTYNLQIPGIGFTQSFELLPGVGQGQTPTAGLPLFAP